MVGRYASITNNRALQTCGGGAQDHVISNNCLFCNLESMAFSIHFLEACAS